MPDPEISHEAEAPPDPERGHEGEAPPEAATSRKRRAAVYFGLADDGPTDVVVIPTLRQTVLGGIAFGVFFGLFTGLLEGDRGADLILRIAIAVPVFLVVRAITTAWQLRRARKLGQRVVRGTSD